MTRIAPLIKRISKGKVPTVITFPGQGQHIPIDLLPSYESRYDLRKAKHKAATQISAEYVDRLFNIDKNKQFLNETSNLQPGIVFTSLLILDILKSKGVTLEANYTIGHSLGELTSLLANGVLDHEKGVHVAYTRGSYMQKELGKNANYGMSALLCPDPSIISVIERIAQSEHHKTVAIANINSPSQVVVSGEVGALGEFVKEVKTFGRVKSIPLKVSVPFHNELLSNTKTKFNEYVINKLNPIEDQKDLEVPIVSNLTGKVVTKHGEAYKNFVEDFTHPVLFSKSIKTILDEFKKTHSSTKVNFINIGPNAFVNQGLIKKNDTEGQVLQNIAIDTPDDIDSFIKNQLVEE